MSAASSAEPSTRRSELYNLSWYCRTKRPKAAESPAKVAAMSEASSLKLGSCFWALAGRINFPAVLREIQAILGPRLVVSVVAAVVKPDEETGRQGAPENRVVIVF